MKLKHQQVKSSFLEAIVLPSDQQKQYIEQITDLDLRKEVQSLVENHVSDFTISIDKPTKKIQPKAHIIQPSSRIFKLLFGNKFKLASTLIIISLFILSIGILTRKSIKNALIDVRTNELKNIINSNHLTMDVWIEEQKKLIDILSKAPRITSKINYLAITYGFGKDGNPNTIWDDSIHQELKDFLDPIIKIEGIPLFSVLDKTGYRIATNEKKDLGKQIKIEDLGYISPVFSQKKITFTRPTLQRIHKSDSNQTPLDIPLTWIDAPIINNEGKVIATLGLSYFSDQGFSKFLNIQKIGENGESYAFDKNGLLVSHSKYRHILQQVGIIAEGQKSILNTTLRNPQTDLTKAIAPPKNYSSLPLILPVANILAKKNKDSVTIELITTPYLNYVGKEVIGAAIWLPKYSFGIVTEIPTSEAFAPLTRLTWIFTILLVVLFSLAIFSTLSSLSLLTLQKKKRTKIGPYFIKEKIGEGGVGEVFLAEHQLLKRPTAIKTLKRNVSNYQNQLRFEREVLLASKLSHPNTINIYDFGRTDDDSFYFAMEFLKGINLIQLNNLCGTVPANRVIHILLQICYSLREAHHKGLIHRDIKPQNIMLCDIGGMYDVVKVLDFGLVKDIEDDTNEDLTQLFEIGGTPMYMSPERLTAPQTVDYQTDIYSVGVVAYYLLTGRKPFLTGVTDIDIINQVINEPPLEINTTDIPNELSQVIYKCMEKDPADRPADINELIAIIEKINPHTWTQQLAEHWWEQKINHQHSELDSFLN